MCYTKCFGMKLKRSVIIVIKTLSVSLCRNACCSQTKVMKDRHMQGQLHKI